MKRYRIGHLMHVRGEFNKFVAHHRPEISFHASGTSNFETDNNHLWPGLDCMAGDLTARTCTHE